MSQWNIEEAIRGLRAGKFGYAATAYPMRRLRPRPTAGKRPIASRT